MKNLLTFIFAGAAIVALGVGFTACDQPEILAETGIDEPEVIGTLPVLTTDTPEVDEPNEPDEIEVIGIPSVSATDIPEITAFFEQHLPISDYENPSHGFNFGDVDPYYKPEPVCLMINSMDEFRAVAPPSVELPEIDFEKYTLVIGHNPGTPSIRLNKQGLETEPDVMILNLVYKYVGVGANPQIEIAFYYWGLYPKLPQKPVTVNVVFTY